MYGGTCGYNWIEYWEPSTTQEALSGRNTDERRHDAFVRDTGRERRHKKVRRVISTFPRMRITFLTGPNSIRVRYSKRSAKSEGEMLAGDLELDWDDDIKGRRSFIGGWEFNVTECGYLICLRTCVECNGI